MSEKVESKWPHQMRHYLAHVRGNSGRDAAGPGCSRNEATSSMPIQGRVFKISDGLEAFISLAFASTIVDVQALSDGCINVKYSTLVRHGLYQALSEWGLAMITEPATTFSRIFKGYDPAAVDAYIEVLLTKLQLLLDEVKDLRARRNESGDEAAALRIEVACLKDEVAILSDTSPSPYAMQHWMAKMMRRAVDDVFRMQAQARAEAEALIAAAEAEAETARREQRQLLEDVATQRKALETECEETRKRLDAELARMRAEAQSLIDEAWQDAKHEREQLLTDAREKAWREVDDVSRMQAQARVEAEALIAAAEAEAQTARREQRQLLEDVATQRKALETECEETRKRLDAELARMRAEAQSLIDEAWQDAKHEREQLLTDAREKARREVDDVSRMQAQARVEAEALIAAAEAEAETARREQRQLLEDVATQRKALETECEETRKRLDAELARMRAEAQSLIDEAWQDAKHEREQLLTDAREKARRAVDEASQQRIMILEELSGVGRDLEGVPASLESAYQERKNPPQASVVVPLDQKNQAPGDPAVAS